LIRWMATDRGANDQCDANDFDESMRTFKIPDALEDAYRGAGAGLAASVDGELVAIVYIDDIIPNFSGEIADLPDAVLDPMVVPTVRYLQTLGKVHVGMMSGWTFTEL
jgi:hypothetical protein